MERNNRPLINEYDEGNSHFFVLPDGSIAETEIDKKNLIIHGLTITDSNRNSGQGSSLLDALEKYGKKAGCTTISGTISYADGDPTPFYQKHGFTISGETITKHIKSDEEDTNHTPN